MLITVWLLRFLFFIWIFGFLFILISKIIHRTLKFKTLGIWVFLLFPFLCLSSKGRQKIKEEILK